MSHTHDFGVVIGQFQPFHNAHLALVEEALRRCERVVLVMGGHRTASSVRTPWSVIERETMIRGAFRNESVSRLQVVGVRDFRYNPAAWHTEVQQRVLDRTGGKMPLLVGHQRGGRDGFPHWEAYDMPLIPAPTAAEIRASYFGGEAEQMWRTAVPMGVADYLSYFQGQPNFERLKREHAHLVDYKARTRYVGASYAPSFTTVDAVVISSGHLLVIRRGGFPGEGQLALPGGFIEADEWPQDAVLRELKEETEIDLDLGALKGRIKEEKVFAAPDRSQRGRTYSIGYLIDLGVARDLPVVKASDDASKTFWMPLADVGVHDAEFFEDHAEIISYFTSRV